MFFFSSRRRHTRCSRDWSSDVCSSDLLFPSGMVGWDRNPRDSLVQFSLYWSPDARYWVKVRATGTELRGHGQSQGFGSGPAVDSVYGRRVGPPDQAKCIAAAKE